jgi:hypothetical protein
MAANDEEGELDEGQEVASSYPPPVPSAEALNRALKNASTFDAEALNRALKNASTFNAEALNRALKNASTFDAEALNRALKNASTFDAEALNRALGFRSQASEQLVPETAVDDEPEEASIEAPNAQVGSVPDLLIQLKSVLREKGFTPELVELKSEKMCIRFDLPAGRSTRSVIVHEDNAQVLLDNDVSRWRSLQRYDGIWSESDGAIEVAIRGDRFGPPIRTLLDRLAGNTVSRGSENSSEYAVESEGGVRLRIGPASGIAGVILSSQLLFARNLITLRLEGISLLTTDQADDYVERVGDSASFGYQLNIGQSFALQRLENREASVRRRRLRRSGPIDFPRNSYPHAPILLYQVGRERSTSPLIRYWAHYQVLEYFFPKFTRMEMVRRMSRHLRSPGFDPHREEHILKALDIALATGGGAGIESEQLLTTIQAIVNPDEILELIDGLDLTEHVTDSRSELTSKILTLKSQPSLLTDLAQRVYDIRCKIVHSKSVSQRQAGPGLLPGTHHDDLVIAELPLIEYLAEQALISAAEPLGL